MAKGYAKSGFVSVAISYRLKTLFPAPIEDVATALRWVKENITKYGGNPSQLFVSGHSAGGHLCTLLSTDHSFMKQHELPPSLIKGCIGISGIYTVESPLDPDPDSFWNKAYRMAYAEPAFGPLQATWHKYSPLLIVQNASAEETAQYPPFLLINANFDLGLDTDGLRFDQQLKARNLNSQWIRLGGCTGHRGVTTNDDTLNHCLNFINNILTPPQ